MIDKVPTTKEIQNFNMKLYSPQNQLIGTMHNELQLSYIQAQIAEQNLEGYYIVYKNETYQIRNDGRIVNFNYTQIKNSYDEMLSKILGF